MARIELGGQVLADTFTAGASISDGEAVAITSADTVQPASDTEVQETIGVADEAAASGEDVQVVVLGRKTVTADGAINPGEPIVPAATAGRVVSEVAAPASHTHTMPTHSHTALQTDGTDATPGAHQGAVAGDGSGTGELVGVSTSGQAAESIPTSSNDPGDTNSADAAPENARAFAIAIGSAGAAGDSIDVLVGFKAG